MLAEDWAKNRPAKDYRSENEKFKSDMREWAAQQKADEGKPLPEALLRDREERARIKGLKQSNETPAEADEGESA